MRLSKKQIARLRDRITDSVSSCGHGCVSLDCDMARKHGFTNAMLEKLDAALKKILARAYGYAKRRDPAKWYTTPDGVDVFVGDMTAKARRAIVAGYEGSIAKGHNAMKRRLF